MNERAYALRGENARDKPDAHARYRAHRSDNHHRWPKQAACDARPVRPLTHIGQGLKKNKHCHETNSQAVTDDHMQHGIQGNGHAVAEFWYVQYGKNHGYFPSVRGISRSILSGCVGTNLGRGCSCMYPATSSASS